MSFTSPSFEAVEVPAAGTEALAIVVNDPPPVEEATEAAEQRMTHPTALHVAKPRVYTYHMSLKKL